MRLFEFKSRQFVKPEDYKQGNFERFLVYPHSNGDRTYCAEQTKTYAQTSGDTEQLTFFSDIRGEEELGYSELRYSLTNRSTFFLRKPFVGYTSTEEDFQKQGLSTRRLVLMNEYAKKRYQQPLYSDTLIRGTISQWDQLVEEGKAEKVEEGGHRRYRFLV